jgi:integrase
MDIKTHKIKNFPISFGIRKDLWIVKLEGKSLLTVSLYLKDLLEHESNNYVRNQASHLKSFYRQILTDFNDWSLCSDTSERRALANSAFKNVTNEYMNGYLRKLALGQLSPSGKKIKPASLKVYTESFRGFFNFCYKHGWLSNKPEFSFNLERELIQTATVGINRQIHNKYYDKVTFLKLLGYVENKDPFIQARNRLALKVTYFMGLRPHELFREDNFKLNGEEGLRELIIKDAPLGSSAQLHINGKGDKDRTVVIYPDVYEELRKFIYIEIPKFEKKIGKKLKGSVFVKKNGEDWFGEKQLSQEVWRGCINNFIAKNPTLSKGEIESWNTRDLYTTRHCFATNMIIDNFRAGKQIDALEVKEIMGHSSFTTTLAAYIYLGAVLMAKEGFDTKVLKQRAVDLYDKAA